MAPRVNEITRNRVRVSCFIDGFNLYHAIHQLGMDALKWVNLAGLMRTFTSSGIHEISSIYYFSAYAEWLIGPCARHKAFVSANMHYGVAPILGNFKPLAASCKRCSNAWTAHEEKQTDVNIAVAIVREAYKDSYDEAFLVSCDSDLAPALELVREVRPDKKIKLVCPPGRKHSKELSKHATALASIKTIHLERNLLPERIETAGGIIIDRPPKYGP